jgi:hypothetical protein
LQPLVIMVGRRAENLVVLGLVVASGWIIGCSGGSTPQDPEQAPNGGMMLPSEPAPGSSSPSGASSSSGATSSGGSGGSVDDCVAACEAKHPQAAKLAKAIDTCWQNNCDSCLAMERGANQGPQSGSCQTDVYTPSADCSQCTVWNCCDAWDACFGNADCVALNKCSVACYK